MPSQALQLRELEQKCAEAYCLGECAQMWTELQAGGGSWLGELFKATGPRPGHPSWTDGSQALGKVPDSLQEPTWPMKRQSDQATLPSFLGTLQPVELGIALPAGPGRAGAQLSGSELLSSL